MAQYTIIQDIEAEDKLLGPLSLRQMIYAGIVIVLGFIAFQLGRATFFLALPFVPPMIFFGLLAAPFGQNQSSEIWLLAKIRYFLFPKKRIWDQAGIQDLITITVPKKIETVYTKGFSNEEVTSRLKALASTLDTRGWAVKNVTTDTYQSALSAGSNSQRLVDIAELPNEDEAAAGYSADVLNEAANPVAEDLAQQLDQSSEEHRQKLLEKVQQLAEKQRKQTSNQVTSPTTSFSQAPVTAPAVVTPKPNVAEPDKKSGYEPIIKNFEEPKKPAQKQSVKKTTSTMTTPAHTDILNGVTDAGSTPSQPNQQTIGDGDSEEVVISLR